MGERSEAGGEEGDKEVRRSWKKEKIVGGTERESGGVMESYR